MKFVQWKAFKPSSRVYYCCSYSVELCSLHYEALHVWSCPALCLCVSSDDCVCYREIKGTEDTVKLQEDIDRLGCWARKWGMRFQPVKCNMQITRKRIKKINASYNLEGTVLDNVENIKYLGITITNDLKWNTHVSNICTKANRTLAFLDVIYQHVHRMLKSRHIKDWCAQSWSMVVQFGTPQVYFFKRRYRKGQLEMSQATTSMKLGAWLAF